MVMAVDGGGGGGFTPDFGIDDDDGVAVLPPPPEPEPLDDGPYVPPANGVPAGGYATGVPYNVQSIVAAAPADAVQGAEPAVPFSTGDPPASVADDWYRAGKADIGMGSPVLYDAYFDFPQMDRITPPHLNYGGGGLGFALEPAALTMRDLATDFAAGIAADGLEIGAAQQSWMNASTAVEAQLLTSVARTLDPGADATMVLADGPLPFAAGPYLTGSQVALEVDVAGAAELGVETDPGQSSAAVAFNMGAFDTPAGRERFIAVMEQNRALQAAWTEATGYAVPPDAFRDRLDRLLGEQGGMMAVTGLAAMPVEQQLAFFDAYGLDPYASDNDGALLIEAAVPEEQALVGVDVSSLAGSTATPTAPLPSEVYVAAVDGLAESTAIPPIAGMAAADWRAALDRWNAAPPASIDAMLADLTLGDHVPDAARELSDADRAGLAAAFNLVAPHPDIALNGVPTFTLAAGMIDGPVTYDAANGVAIVNTSLDALAGGEARLAARLAQFERQYLVADVPITLRIPLPPDPSGTWSAASIKPADLTAAQLADLQGQLAQVQTVDLFMHGYQSTRGVWTPTMQDWMNATVDESGQPLPVIGVAIAGMGSEGDFIGSPDVPYTPKQYAFSAMETLDLLGLYRADLNVFGHSMGGAAAMQMGLAFDRMPAGVRGGTDVDYVLLQPAASGDSVPFLTDTPVVSSAIAFQNGLGDWGWLGEDIANMVSGDVNISGAVVERLIPTAPAYIKSIHANFSHLAGFNQLSATALGLVSQPETPSADIAAWMAANDVMVVAGAEDRIVGSPQVMGFYGDLGTPADGVHFAAGHGRVYAGGHYAHVENPAILRDVRAFLQPDVLPAHGPR